MNLIQALKSLAGVKEGLEKMQEQVDLMDQRLSLLEDAVDRLGEAPAAIPVESKDPLEPDDEPWEVWPPDELPPEGAEKPASLTRGHGGRRLGGKSQGKNAPLSRPICLPGTLAPTQEEIARRHRISKSETKNPNWDQG